LSVDELANHWPLVVPNIASVEMLAIVKDHGLWNHKSSKDILTNDLPYVTDRDGSDDLTSTHLVK